MTDVVILVGGKGSRLGNITKNTPKPLIKINNKSFLDFLLSKLISYNFKNIYLLCSFKKEKFFKKYHKRKIHNSKIFCIDEGSPKDTGGSLYKVRKKIKNDFFLLNGDTFFDINLNFLSFLSQKKIVGTIALTNNLSYQKNKKINNLSLNKYNYLKFSKSKTKFMNGGIYHFNKRIFRYISNKKLSLENDILRKLIFENKIKGIYFEGSFIDIGSINKLNFLKKNPNFLGQKTVFLDRDGVINKLNPFGYIEKFNQFKFLPGVIKAINFLNKMNYRVIIITNQACVGKSIISENKLNQIHIKMREKLYVKNKSFIDDIYYSPYYKFSKKKKYRINSFDRKPNPGMLLKAIKKWNININDSFFIGDSISDFNAAKKIKIKFYFKKKISLYKQIKTIINK